MRPWLTTEIGVVSLLIMIPVAVPSYVVTTPIAGWIGPSPSVPTAFGPDSTHLQHVITVVMENRDYDNYFGTYCQTLGPYCSTTGNGLPAGLCVVNIPSLPSSGCTKPFNLTAADMNITPDLNHDWVSGLTAWDDGKMDGFYQAENRGSLPFGHYNGSTIPIYWDMAEQYAIGDDMFAANLSYSLPNHWYLIAGQAPNITQHSKLRDTNDRLTYLSQANNTSTIQDVLNGTSVSWKYYDYNLSTRAAAIGTVHYTGPDSAYDYWNPMASRAESYTPTYNSHFATRASLLTDLANGTLPNISWVIPVPNASDHPGYNETPGESWVAQLVDSVETSRYWGTTAIFVVWDDYGGWYDNVAPPRVMTKLLSFRSPILVISPYARENYISHQFVDFFSLLRFVEWQFNLGCVTALDCTAPLPFGFFDFNQTARLPIVFSTDWQNATYPMTLQPIGARVLCDGCFHIDPSLWAEAGPMTGNISMDT
jgi:phospholipase C